MMTAREIADLANHNARTTLTRPATAPDVAAIARAAGITPAAPATPGSAALYTEPDAVVIYATAKAQTEHGLLP